MGPLTLRHQGVLAAAFLLTLLPAAIAGQHARPVSRPVLHPQSLPQWFQPGTVRPARWDGGPIEAQKGILTGYFPTDDPRLLEAERNWYDAKTIQFLKAAHINWAWVTWSNGFSPQTEGPQQALVRNYIALCHQNNIRVAAYISIGNMFWQDMFEHLPASIAWVKRLPDGSPLFYSRPYRYMADITNLAWLKFQKERVAAAVRAGADAIWVDNTFQYYGERQVEHFIDSIYAAAARINPHVVIMSNYNRGIYTWARLQNGVTTEDGQEPGYYTDRPKPFLVTNAGLMRHQYAVGGGGRPVSVEDGRRHVGTREGTLLESHKWQLEIAEAAMYHVGLEIFVEGAFARDLYFGEAEALRDLHAIGTYNAFLERNEEYYLHPQSLARVAILSDTTDAVVPYLNQLSEYNLNYDVIFNYQPPQREAFRKYKVILLPNTNPLSKDWCIALGQWVRKEGGTLIAVQDASLFSPDLASRNQDFGLGEPLGVSKRNIPESTVTRPRGKGLAIYLPELLTAEKMVSLIRLYLRGSELVEVEPHEAILSNAAYQPAHQRIVAHFLNYRQKPEKGIRMHVRAPVERAEILSPDDLSETKALIQRNGGGSDIVVPELRTYDVLVIYLGGKEGAAKNHYGANHSRFTTEASPMPPVVGGHLE